MGPAAGGPGARGSVPVASWGRARATRRPDPRARPRPRGNRRRSRRRGLGASHSGEAVSGQSSPSGSTSAGPWKIETSTQDLPAAGSCTIGWPGGKWQYAPGPMIVPFTDRRPSSTTTVCAAVCRVPPRGQPGRVPHEVVLFTGEGVLVQQPHPDVPVVDHRTRRPRLERPQVIHDGGLAEPHHSPLPVRGGRIVRGRPPDPVSYSRLGGAGRIRTRDTRVKSPLL